MKNLNLLKSKKSFTNKIQVVIKENMTENDFVDIQVLSLNLPNKIICVSNHAQGQVNITLHSKGEIVFECVNESLTDEQELMNFSHMILEMVTKSGGFEEFNKGFKAFLNLLENTNFN